MIACFQFRRWLAGAALMVMLVTVGGTAEPRRTLTLNDAYQLAVQRSENLQITAQEIKAAEARYWQAVGAVLPQVSAYARESLANRTADRQRRDSFQAGLSGSWLVFDGFRQTNLAGAEAATKRGLTADLQRQRQLLFLDIGDVYLQICGLAKDLDVLRDLTAALRDRQRELRERIDLGRSRRSELLSTETDLADSEAEIATVSGVLGASRELLAFLIGVPGERWSLSAPPGGLPRAEKLFDYLWKAGARADLQAAAEYTTAARRVVSADQGSFWPAVSVGAGWVAAESPAGGQDWNVTVSAELPVFDGGQRAARLAESTANLRVTELNLTRTRRLADYEVRLAYNNFISSADRWLKLSVASASAKENYQAQQHDYELGRSNNLDVLVALTNWHQLRRRLLATEIQARANLINLEVAAGSPSAVGGHP
ncbi:MAG: TolC family protein [Verrucomicrobiales bacterium]|jgi:outer membrane protein TolC|nr:TolC family protein [Verrucomicrobiales bacterium]